MDIFTTCERCGEKAKIYIKAPDMGNSGLDPKHYGTLEPENKLTISQRGNSFVKDYVLCEKCTDDVIKFLGSKLITEESEKPIDPPIPP